MIKALHLIAILLFFSCAEKLMEPPENLIPKETMTEILRDMVILNAARTTNVSILKKNDVDPMSYLYAKYNIDSTQLVNSDLYYASMPEVYEAIYTKVEARLAAEKDTLDRLKKQKDSISALALKKKREATGTKDSL